MVRLAVENSPFNQEQADLLNRLLPALSEQQLIWLSGYLAAYVAQRSQVSIETKPGLNGTAVLEKPASSVALPAGQLNGGPTAAIPREVTVLYGTDTGNSKRLAETFRDRLAEQGFKVTCSSMDEFKPQTLKQVELLFIVVSTHGEGEPPDNARSFYEYLHSRKAPRLDKVRYSVLALGDSSYEHFCQTGKDFDKRLEELGGERLFERVDCDVDFEETAKRWMDGVLERLSALAGQGLAHEEAAGTFTGSVAVLPQAQATVTLQGVGQQGTEAPVYSRTNPFPAEVLENINLNGRGSTQETRHVELSLEGSGFSYEPGDCIGIYPENDPALVDELIEAMGWSKETPVPLPQKGEELPLEEALRTHYEITVLTKPLLEKVASLSSNEKLQELLKPENGEALKAYLSGRDLLDLARDFSLSGLPAQEFVPLLRKIPPRLYSIASSFQATPDEAHLVVRTVRYTAHGRNRTGVCSGYVAERVKPGDTMPVYVHPNPQFKLPADPDVPLIMIGPGAGVAPFRSFLAEREVTGAKGKTWLFFGDRHFLTDFLYQVEWQRWLKDGVLTRMDVAFSRDQEEKVYVQHRMLEKGKELYAWLKEGAHLYVCGDKKRMAKDVHDALVEIIHREGGLSKEESEAYLAELRKEKRYQRDVY